MSRCESWGDGSNLVSNMQVALIPAPQLHLRALLSMNLCLVISRIHNRFISSHPGSIYYSFFIKMIMIEIWRMTTITAVHMNPHKARFIHKCFSSSLWLFGKNSKASNRKRELTVATSGDIQTKRILKKPQGTFNS